MPRVRALFPYAAVCAATRDARAELAHLLLALSLVSRNPQPNHMPSREQRRYMARHGCKNQWYRNLQNGAPAKGLPHSRRSS